MTEEERVEKYGRPTQEDYWITSFPRWDFRSLNEPPVLKSRFFKVPK